MCRILLIQRDCVQSNPKNSLSLIEARQWSRGELFIKHSHTPKNNFFNYAFMYEMSQEILKQRQKLCSFLSKSRLAEKFNFKKRELSSEVSCEQLLERCKEPCVIWYTSNKRNSSLAEGTFRNNWENAKQKRSSIHAKNLKNLVTFTKQARMPVHRAGTCYYVYPHTHQH